MLGRRLVFVLAWVVLPLVVCWLIVGRHHGDVWFFYDEWGVIKRVIAPGSDLTKAFHSFNGRLWALVYVAYAMQTHLFGLDSHLFVYAVFCGSLVALNVSLAAMLRVFGVPTALALAAAIAVTYLGHAAQLSVFAINFSWNLAMALGFVAVALIARRKRTRWMVVIVAAALLLATLADSGIATIVLVFVAVVAAWRWGIRDAVIAIAPATLVLAAWSLLAPGDRSIVPVTSLATQLRIAGELILASAGALVDGGQLAGAIVVVTGGVVIGVGIAWKRVPAEAIAVLLAGGLATVIGALAISRTRAGLLRSGFFQYNRYLGLLAMLEVAAMLPALCASLRSSSASRDRVLTVAATAGVTVIFVANLTAHDAYRDVFTRWSGAVAARTSEAVRVVANGCPAGTELRSGGRPAGSLSPQVTVALLRELRARGALTPSGVAVEPDLLERVCGPR